MTFNPQDANGEAWLQLYTDFIVAQRQLEPGVAGYFVIAQKLQNYVNSSVDVLEAWIAGTANTGWNIATDSGGTGSRAEWSLNGSVKDSYANRRTQTIVDVFDATKRLIDILRQKDPGAIIMYEPYNSTVQSWRNAGYRSSFQSNAITKYPSITSNADADKYWAELITYCANAADAIVFYSDDVAEDFSKQWSDNIRGFKDKWVLHQDKPQDISLLANQ